MMNNYLSRWLKVVPMCVLLAHLTACQDDSKLSVEQQAELERTLAPLNIKIQAADYAVPFCEKKDCLNMSIQSVSTQNDDVNQWVARSQSYVIQQQIGLDQNLTLQEAVDAYVKKSDAWRAEDKKNKAYNLQMATRIALQRQSYVLIQLMVHSQQGSQVVDNQVYYFVFDRKQNKGLKLLDILKDDHQHRLHDIIQTYYKEWRGKQSAKVKAQLPDVLYWGQADWFFDQGGIGLHYRKGQISADAPIFDIYLTPEQGKAMVKEDIYKILFPHLS